MKKLFLSLLCFSMSFSLYAQTFRNGSDNGLNLRSQPSTSAAVVTSVPANAKVRVIDSSDSEWYKVSYNGKTGYVSAKYLTEENKQSQNNSSARNNNSSDKNKSSNNSSNKSKGAKKSSGGSGADYNTGIGLRAGGWESGLTVKHFIKNGAAIEGILSTGWRYGGSRITGLYEMQKPLGNTDLQWFWGVGAHLGMYRDRYWHKGDCDKDGGYTYNGRWYDCDDSRMVIGLDLILGLEYKLPEIPITIGVDIKPSIDVLGWGGSYIPDAAFSFRYVF